MSAQPHPWRSGLLRTAAGFVAAAGCTIAVAQVRGSDTGLRHGMPDRKTMSYVSACLGAAPTRPVELYARGGWFVTDDLREQLRERAGNVEGLALVWKLANRPRAVYQWNHDDEFNRDAVACLDAGGKVTRSQSHYTPGDSEPNQRWIYIHTLATNPNHGTLHGAGRFTDASGHAMGRPHLTTEDQDFIAGERVYHQWTDFDFANLLSTQEQ